jgi:glutamyl/glutaminyl-tRNA synthetase
MRGQEFVSSTPKFLSLYDALEHTPPLFATLPPILGEEGTKKLGKRDGAKDLLEYRAEGYLPEAMVNFLALLGWHPSDDREILSTKELIATFDIERVQRGGARFDEEKLLFINREWLQKLSDDDYVRQGGFDAPDTDRFMKALPLIKSRAHTFSEARDIITGEFSWLFATPALDQSLLTAKEGEGRVGKTHEYLAELLTHIEALPEAISAEECKAALMPLADREEAAAKGGRGAVLWPLRYALSGAERSPDPFSLIFILGKDEAASRVRNALAILA